MTNQRNQFLLDVRIDKLTPMKVSVVETITVGLDPRNDIVLSSKKISKKHMTFIMKGENLALHYHSIGEHTYLNSQAMDEDKTYLLDAGDTIKLPGAEIIVLQGLFESEADEHHVSEDIEEIEVEEIEEDEIEFTPMPMPGPTKKPLIVPKLAEKPSFDKGKFLNLWLVKIYSLFVDIFLTYLFLIYALPLVHADPYAVKILDFIKDLILPEVTDSYLPFLIAWYVLSLVQSIVFGKTLGQFLLGLKYSKENKFLKLVLSKIKSLLFSFVLLPGQNEVSDKFFYRAMRRYGMFFIFLFILVAPLFLPAPFNKTVTIIDKPAGKKSEVHTKTLVSSSKKMQISIKAEIPQRYLLLPYIGLDKTLMSFQLTDLKNSQSIIISEKDQLTNLELEEKLKYANPFYSLLHPTPFKDWPLQDKKIFIREAFMLSPENIHENILNFGPFFGSTVLFKEMFLEDTNENDTVVKFYSPETPVIFVGSAQQDYFYLITPHGLSRFVVDSTKRSPLVTVFDKEIISKLVSGYTKDSKQRDRRTEILEVQDDYLHGNEQTLLTYYVEVAMTLKNSKLLSDEVDLTEKGKAIVVKNITTIEKFINDKAIVKALDDIKNQLTPMENPGEK